MNLINSNNIVFRRQRWIKNAMVVWLLGAASSVNMQAVAAAVSGDDLLFQDEVNEFADRWEGIYQAIFQSSSSPGLAPGLATAVVKASLTGDETPVTTRMLDRIRMNDLNDIADMFGGASGLKVFVDKVDVASKAIQQIAAEGNLPLNPNGQGLTVSNLRAGDVSATSTEAVNGSQLAASNERLGEVVKQLDELASRATSDNADAKRYTDTNVDAVQRSVSSVEGLAKQVRASLDQLDTQLDELTVRTSADTAAAKAYTDANVGAVRQSLSAVEQAAGDATASINEVKGNIRVVQQEVRGAVQVKTSLAAPQATGSDSVAVGGGSRAGGERSVALGARAGADGVNSSAVGINAKAMADNSVAVGANSVAERANTVSVGGQGFERRVVHVGAGTRDTDAVNLAQLTRATAYATEQAHTYTDQRYAQLRSDLKQQDSILSAGIAGAMAMANLPRSTVGGGSMTSVGLGNYRGESALAVGISYVSESGRWSSNVMGSTNTRNDTGAAVGVGYQW